MVESDTTQRAQFKANRAQAEAESARWKYEYEKMILDAKEKAEARLRRAKAKAERDQKNRATNAAEEEAKQQRFVPWSQRAEPYIKYAEYLRAEVDAHRAQQAKEMNGAAGGGESTGKKRTRKEKVPPMPAGLGKMLHASHQVINEHFPYEPNGLYATKRKQWAAIAKHMPNHKVLQLPVKAMGHATGIVAGSAGSLADMAWQMTIANAIPSAFLPFIPRAAEHVPSILLHRAEDKLGMIIPEKIVGPIVGKVFEVAIPIYDRAKEDAANAAAWIMHPLSPRPAIRV